MDELELNIKISDLLDEWAKKNTPVVWGRLSGGRWIFKVFHSQENSTLKSWKKIYCDWFGINFKKTIRNDTKAVCMMICPPQSSSHKIISIFQLNVQSNTY